jgi:acyl carrier protein
MALPQGVTNFLNESAESAGAPPPSAETDLFKSGVLDSFALIDFVAVLEEECGVKVPDADVNPANFQTMAAIERYVEAHKG